MAIPGFQDFFRPIVEFFADGKDHANAEVVAAIAERFEIGDEDRKALLPSGRQPVFDNRIMWAMTHLRHALLIERVSRGVHRISERGRQALASGPAAFNMNYLTQYPEFVDFRTRKSVDQEPKVKDGDERVDIVQTPEETIAAGYQTLRDEIEAEILGRLRRGSPMFFETVVVDLLLAMGYGGSRREAGMAIGKSGDEGIDGVINEDKLGLDVVYIQAKRWEGTIGRPDIQKFVGALQGQKANKGVFITTSGFSKDAVEYARVVGTKVVLIDGNRLAELLYDHGVGLTTQTVYEIKRIDSDYFAEE